MKNKTQKSAIPVVELAKTLRRLPYMLFGKEARGRFGGQVGWLADRQAGRQAGNDAMREVRQRHKNLFEVVPPAAR